MKRKLVATSQNVADFNNMDDIAREQIKNFTNGFRFKNFFVLENIPQRKLKNAIKSYAPYISENETIIYLYDDTLFNSGKDGFILTSKRLYQKNMLEDNLVIDIESISKLSFSDGFPVKIIVKVALNSFNIELSHGTSSEKNTLFNILDNTIKLLQGNKIEINNANLTTAQEAKSQKQNHPMLCLMCGAPFTKHQTVCEYCGGSLQG